MQTLTIGSTVLEIKNCTRMRDTQKGFYLDIKIPKGAVTMDELEKLFDGNEETIIVVDNDGNESAYNGFKLLSNLSLENGVYRVCQACVSEIEAQLSIAQYKVAEQEKALVAINNAVALQADTIAMQEENSAELLYQVCLLQLGMNEEDM